MFHFEVGKQVVCIRDRVFEIDPHPVKNQVYTVRGLFEHQTQAGWLGLLFEEVRATLPPCSCCGVTDVSWYSGNFRPVRETRIDEFTEILKKVPKPLPVLAREIDLVYMDLAGRVLGPDEEVSAEGCIVRSA